MAPAWPARVASVSVIFIVSCFPHAWPLLNSPQYHGSFATQAMRQPGCRCCLHSVRPISFASLHFYSFAFRHFESLFDLQSAETKPFGLVSSSLSADSPSIFRANSKLNSEFLPGDLILPGITHSQPNHSVHSLYTNSIANAKTIVHMNMYENSAKLPYGLEAKSKSQVRTR